VDPNDAEPERRRRPSTVILLARSLAKTLVLTRLPEFAQPFIKPYIAAADRLLQRFQKVKLFQPLSSGLATARTVLVVKQTNPRGRDRTSNQLPRSKTNEG
jgi:hypothetical protein